MPSSYSTNLKIELQATGENAGTWGTITNTNLGTTLEQAIVGYGNPNFGSDANLTLSYTDDNAAQAARALVLNVTSTGSLTATREMIVPTIQKQYIVQNNTTGSQSITVKTSAGTGITVPNGLKAHLYVDGTNVIQMFDFVDINGGAIDGTPIGANSASTGAFTTLSSTGNTTIGSDASDTVTVNADVASNLVPSADDSYDLGAVGSEWKDLFVDGTANIDSLVADTADINGGTLDNVQIGESVRNSGKFTTLDANGNVILGSDAADTVTINADVASNVIPSADNTYDLGASGSEWKDLYIDGTANIDSLIADTADINGGTIDGTAIGSAAASTGVFTQVDVDNIRIDANTISATNVDGNVTITPNGTGALSTTKLTASADSAFTSTGALTISKGTTGEQPGAPATGMLRYNTTTNQFEGYSGASPAWKSVGGAAVSNDTSTTTDLYPAFLDQTTGTAENVYTSNAKLLYKPSTGEFKAAAPIASNGIILNNTSVTESYTIASGTNGFSVGPLTVNSGVTLTISSGQRHIVI